MVIAWSKYGCDLNGYFGGQAEASAAGAEWGSAGGAGAGNDGVEELRIEGDRPPPSP